MLNYVTALYNKASLRALPGVPLAGKPLAKILFQKINRSSVCYSIVMSPKTQYSIIANKCFIVNTFFEILGFIYVYLKNMVVFCMNTVLWCEIT